MRISRVWAAAAAIILLASSEARAQGPAVEGALGYSFLSDRNTGIEFPFGWIASIGGNATNWLAFVGEVGGNYKQYTAGTAELSLKMHTFAAGPRLMVPATSPVAPYVQLLFGIAHGSADLGVPGASIVVRGTTFLSSLNAGVDFNASQRRAFRVEFAGRRLTDAEDSGRQWRVIAAFVFRK